MTLERDRPCEDLREESLEKQKASAKAQKWEHAGHDMKAVTRPVWQSHR